MLQWLTFISQKKLDGVQNDVATCKSNFYVTIEGSSTRALVGIDRLHHRRCASKY